MIDLPTIRKKEDVEVVVEEYGFLPFFANELEGFSIEEHILPGLWFSSTVEGPWEWKGPIARTRNCAYGKLFRGKAGFVSREWLPDLVNYRRDGYDFDSRYEDGGAPLKDKLIFDPLWREGLLTTDELKTLSGFTREGIKGFDTCITRLQMQTYVTVEDFIYRTDKRGKTYGWGVARYAPMEYVFGEEYVRSAYSDDPAYSFEKILRHLQRVLGAADEKKIIRLIK